MLQFWKKPGTSDSCTKNTNFKGSCDRSKPKTIDEGELYDIEEYESMKEHSKLAKTLQEVMSDKSALNYFIQYMESRNAAGYILCLMDIDRFKLDRTSKISSPVPNQNNNNQYNPASSMTTTNSNNKIENNDDSLSISTDCDSLTADTNSLDYSDRVTITPLQQQGLLNCDKILNGDTSPLNKTDIALNIYKKYLSYESIYNIKLDEKLRNETIENICDNNKVLNGICFDQVQNYLYNIIEIDYFYAFLASDYYAKHQIDILTSGCVTIDDILLNETALFYFMEFLEQENCKNLLEFWIAATNFHQQLNNNNNNDFYDPIEAQNDAVVLYDKYFSLQAHSPLGFSDKIRLELEQNICGENGLISNCFYITIKYVEQILERNYLKLFLDSQLFYKYLSELINTVQANGYSINLYNKNQRSKSISEYSESERSFSTNNTFLALEYSPNYYKKNNNDNRDKMSIDTRQLCDPDSLWKRKKCSLSCGRITELGKFETNLEPEPDKKESKLKNVVKKFVNFDNDDEKKKEEMAWQVAEMIVKDITNVTLQQQHQNVKPSNL